MSQILDKQGIKNQIISFPGHVIVAVQYANGSEIMYDPDFGVTIPYTVAQVHQSPALIKSYYLQQDYSKSDADILSEIYAGDFERWNGVSHFITKKYYFEIIAYYLKWP